MHKPRNGNYPFRVEGSGDLASGLLITIQIEDCSTLFRLTNLLALSDPSTHSRRDGLSPKQSRIPIGPRLAFQCGKCA